MNGEKPAVPRKQALEALVIVIAVFLILLILSFVLVGNVLGPLTVVLIMIVVMGILSRKKPEWFRALSKKKNTQQTNMPYMKPEERGGSQRTYMMLVGLNASSHHSIRINASPFIIGSDAGANYRLEDPYISKQHLSIQFQAVLKAKVTDLSRNGTYLNSVLLPKGKATELKNGDTIQIASYVFRVEYVRF